jgi:hypothetical protein
MSKSPRCTHARSGHSARGEAHVEPLKPDLARPGPTEREPRSHCFDVTHQVRGRAAKRARHRRGHIFSPPRRMEASGEVAQLVDALREAQPGRATVRSKKLAR